MIHNHYKLTSSFIAHAIAMLGCELGLLLIIEDGEASIAAYYHIKEVLHIKTCLAVN